MIPIAVHADCKAPKRGPSGPIGPTGPPGPAGTLTSAYVSSFNQDGQNIGTTLTNIIFSVDLVGHVNISHPTPDEFVVAMNGVYQISWVFDLFWSGIGTDHIFVFLKVNGSNVTGDRVGSVDLVSSTSPSTSATVSGSLYVRLAAGDVVTMQMIGSEDFPTSVPAVVEPAIFSMSLIAP